MKNLSVFPKTYFIPLVFGCFLGALILLDHYLTNTIANTLHFSTKLKKIIKSYPYGFSTTVFVFVLISPLIKKFVSRIVSNPEKSFLLFFLIGLHTIALTSMGLIDLSELILIVFFLVLLIKFMTKKETVKLTALDLINLLFVMSVFLSAINGGTFSFIRYSITMIKFLLIVFVIVNSVRNRDNLVFFLKWLVILTTISSVISIVQEATYLTTGKLIAGFIDKEGLKFMFESTSIGNLLRVPAFFGTYKPFTFFLNTALLIVFNYFLYNKPFDRKKLSVLAFSFLVMCTALLLTFSIDGLLSFLISLILSLLIWRPYLIVHLSLFILAVVIVISILGFWDDILSEISAVLHWGDQRIRLQLARENISGFLDRHPWIGAGIGNSRKYTGHFFGWSAHNALIEAAGDVGVLGLLVYLALLCYTFLNIIKLNLIVRKNSNKWIARSILFSFIAFIIAIQFHPFFIEKFNWLLMSIVQAFALIAIKEKQVFSEHRGN